MIVEVLVGVGAQHFPGSGRRPIGGSTDSGTALARLAEREGPAQDHRREEHDGGHQETPGRTDDEAGDDEHPAQR